MESPIVTLTTDWGTKDFFSGMVKGRLYSLISGVRVVDITHNIDPYNLVHAAFVVKNGCMEFPKGTIHIIDVNTVETRENGFIIVVYKGQYFICTDNGLPSLVFEDKWESVTLINAYQDSSFYTFAAYNLFCKIAMLLAADTDLVEIGERVDALKPCSGVSYVENKDSLLAYVMYIDNYGNVYLNVKYSEFNKIRKGRAFELRIGKYKVTEVLLSYADTQQNGPLKQLVLTVSATGYLQLALNQASAQQLLGMKVREPITIVFHEEM